MTKDGSRAELTGILLIYHHEPPYAATVMEHVRAFREHSRFPVWEVNVDHGFPRALAGLSPTIIVLHYSLFGAKTYPLSPAFLDWLKHTETSYRIAFFQDEYQFCPQRFEFIDTYRINCVYTLIEPDHHDMVYGRHTHGPKVVYTLPGYVSDDLVRTASQSFVPDTDRTCDIGYRGRSLPYYMGLGSQEKRDIGVRFLARAEGLGLSLDIAVDENARLYGQAWTRFLANARAVIGVEAGVSIFDVTGEVYSGYERLVAENPEMTFEEMSARLLAPFEGNVPYRTVSPRHFEAAAFRVVQILFEGEYSGVLEPMIHYLPLKKNFSNFDEVIALFRDPEVRQAVSDRTYADLIASGRYTYSSFVRSFDEDLATAGFAPSSDQTSRQELTALLTRGTALRRLRSRGRPFYRKALPHPLRVRLRRLIDTAREHFRRRRR